MTKTQINPSPAERALAKQIVKEAGNVRIKFGRTNGKVVLHVATIGGWSPAPDRGAFTISSLGDWLTCPLNPEVQRRADRVSGDSPKREQEIDALTGLIANRDAI